MSWIVYQAVAVVNLIFCLGIFWACICRLNTNVCRHYISARLRYTALMGVSVASGLQPLLWQEWPSVVDTVFSGVVLMGLVINVMRWRRRAAEEGAIHHGN